MTDLSQLGDLTVCRPDPKPAPSPGGIGKKKPGGTRSQSRAPGDYTPDTVAAGIFKEVVCSESCIGAQIPGHVCDGPLQAMHVVPKATLKKRRLWHLMYDPSNGIPGCYEIHRRHDNKVELIPRSLLPARCIRWANEHGVLDALERHWPEPLEDRRSGATAAAGDDTATSPSLSANQDAPRHCICDDVMLALDAYDLCCPIHGLAATLGDAVREIREADRG